VVHVCFTKLYVVLCVSESKGLDDRMMGVRLPAGVGEFFFSTPCPDWLWGPTQSRTEWVLDGGRSFLEGKAAGSLS
jgi:hypothetical protein